VKFIAFTRNDFCQKCKYFVVKQDRFYSIACMVTLLQTYRCLCQWKYFENRSIFDKVRKLWIYRLTAGAVGWCSAAFSAVHLRRRHPVPTKTPVFLRRSCLSRLSNFLLLDVAPSLAIVLAFGTPSDVTSSPSLFTFKRRLKKHLFRLSYPDQTF